MAIYTNTLSVNVEVSMIRGTYRLWDDVNKSDVFFLDVYEDEIIISLGIDEMGRIPRKRAPEIFEKYEEGWYLAALGHDYDSDATIIGWSDNATETQKEKYKAKCRGIYTGYGASIERRNDAEAKAEKSAAKRQKEKERRKAERAEAVKTAPKRFWREIVDTLKC